MLEPVGAYDPTGHLAHMGAPLDSEKEPAAQGAHLIEPGGDQKPGSQGLQERSLLTPMAALNVPAGQSLHGFRPCFSDQSPAGQSCGQSVSAQRLGLWCKGQVANTPESDKYSLCAGLEQDKAPQKEDCVQPAQTAQRFSDLR